MSTPELLLLLKILPDVQRNPPPWMTAEERAVLERLVSELMGVSA